VVPVTAKTFFFRSFFEPFARYLDEYVTRPYPHRSQPLQGNGKNQQLRHESFVGNTLGGRAPGGGRTTGKNESPPRSTNLSGVGPGAMQPPLALLSALPSLFEEYAPHARWFPSDSSLFHYSWEWHSRCRFVLLQYKLTLALLLFILHLDLVVALPSPYVTDCTSSFGGHLFRIQREFTTSGRL